ncbi:MAG: hypothetical protein ACK5IM_04395 [Demequina sp.]|uniref:hypothetical protein n=1 Tax=Demequina sp. TaxID=2050685 RepID=UPI003A836468
MKMLEAERQTRWGKVRGARRIPALAVAIPGGLLLAVVAGAVAATLIEAPSPALVGFAVGGSASFPSIALIWAVIVDRGSLRGALERPELSVEGAWYDRAAAGALSDVLLVIGLATAALAITGAPTDVVIALVGVLLLAMGSCAIRYLLLSRRG